MPFFIMNENININIKCSNWGEWDFLTFSGENLLLEALGIASSLKNVLVIKIIWRISKRVSRNKEKMKMVVLKERK